MMRRCNCLNMWRALLLFSLFLATVAASGKFSVIHTPKKVSFKGDDALETDSLGDAIAGALGYSIQDTAHWSALYLENPFEVARVGFVIYVDGVEDFPLKNQEKSYQLVGNSAQESLNYLQSTLEKSNSFVMDLDLNQGKEAFVTYPEILGNIKVPSSFKSTKYLKPKLHAADQRILQQLSMLDSITEQVASFDNKIGLVLLRLSVSPVITTHGSASPATAEALELVSESIDNLAKATTKQYPKELLFVTIADKSEYYRSKRQAEKDNPQLNPDNVNLATYYSEDYPVIFNIILWFGVVFVFSLLAISYAIATMDPGRDSIIYRMTSTRMKKDN